MVTLTGFEPVDAALRGLRLKPLVDRAIRFALQSLNNISYRKDSCK